MFNCSRGFTRSSFDSTKKKSCVLFSHVFDFRTSWEDRKAPSSLHSTQRPKPQTAGCSTVHPLPARRQRATCLLEVVITFLPEVLALRLWVCLSFWNSENPWVPTILALLKPLWNHHKLLFSHCQATPKPCCTLKASGAFVEPFQPLLWHKRWSLAAAFDPWPDTVQCPQQGSSRSLRCCCRELWCLRNLRTGGCEEGIRWEGCAGRRS